MADELPRVEQEKVLLSWKAKSRPYKPAEEQTRSVLVVLGILVGLVLIFAREFMLLLVIIAGAFYYYAITRTPPEQVEYSITNKGDKSIRPVVYVVGVVKVVVGGKAGDQVIGTGVKNRGNGEILSAGGGE